MSLLASKFDIQSVDNPVALAALAQVLAVSSPPSPSVNTQGTPVAGTIQPGAIVAMDSTGKAVLATAPDITAAEKVMPFTAIDGNVDFSGAFVQKLTVLQGGFTMVTDQFEAGTYTPGLPVTFNAGKITPKTSFADKRQIYGFVGPAGYDATGGTVQVIVPQFAA